MTEPRKRAAKKQTAAPAEPKTWDPVPDVPPPTEPEPPDDTPVETVEIPVEIPVDPAPQAVTPDDAEFDRVTALQTFLQSNEWYPYRVDGDYGPRTLEGVQQLQRFLRAQGFYVGPIDGIYGDETRSALSAQLGQVSDH